eukprot:m51a1_g11949 hypothetical protein (436) ;mRNA; f:749678-751122
MLLGVDIGTSTIAAVLVDPTTRSVVSSTSAPTPPGSDAQSHLRTALEVVRALGRVSLASVLSVGVTGQMHGVVLARASGGSDAEFAGLLPQGKQEALVGHGCATLAWWASRGDLPAEPCVALPIADLFVSRLCANGGSRAVSPATASAFGLYDVSTRSWDDEALASCSIPSSIMPAVVPAGTSAGSVSAEASEILGVPEGVPVGVSVGDFEALAAAVATSPLEDVVVDIGATAQFAAVIPRNTNIEEAPGLSFELRPYSESHQMLTAVSMCGGAAWQWLAGVARSWLTDLCGTESPLLRCSEEEMNNWLSDLGLECLRKGDVEPLVVRTSFCGELRNPGLTGSIEGITMGNFTVGRLAAAVARGIAKSLVEMVPREALAGRCRVVGCGNALRRSVLLQRALAKELSGMELVMSPETEEAATGAALLAMPETSSHC